MRLGSSRSHVQEGTDMAKGQMRQVKEKKKAKADNKTKPVSAYKAQFGSGSSGSSNQMGATKKN